MTVSSRLDISSRSSGISVSIDACRVKGRKAPPRWTSES